MSSETFVYDPATDWIPLIKEYGESRAWVSLTPPRRTRSFRQKRTNDPRFPKHWNHFTSQCFVAVYVHLASLTPAERATINDWPTLRPLVVGTLMPAYREHRLQMNIDKQAEVEAVEEAHGTAAEDSAVAQDGHYQGR